MKEFVFLLKKTMFSPIMFITFLIGTILLIYPIFPDIIAALFYNEYDQRPACMYFITIMHTVGVFDLFAPALASVTCSSIYYDDLYRKCIFNILPRTSRHDYLITKILVCSVTGGIAVLCPLIVVTMLSLICGKPYLSDGGTSFLENTCMDRIQFIGGGMFTILILLILSFIFGALWATVGMMMSAFFENKYTSYVAPFMIYFGSSMIMAQSETLLKFSPINMLFPDYYEIPSVFFCFSYQITLYIFVVGIFYIKANWRLKNGI